MGQVLVQAATLVAIIALGQGIKRLGWVTAADFGPLSRIVLRVTLPCALVTSFNTFEVRVSMLWLSVFGAAAVLAGQLTTFLLERPRGRQAQAFGVFNVANFNIGLFAVPYVATFVGPEAIVIASMFDLGNSLAAAGFGYGAGMALASGRRSSPGAFALTMLKSPVFDTYLVLVAMRLLGITLPAGLIGFTSLVGGANTFLAMLIIGIGLELVLPRASVGRAARFLATRYVVVVAVGLVLWNALPFAQAEKVVLLACLAAPMAVMVSGFTDEAGLAVAASTFMTTVTVVVSIVAIPAVILLLG